MASESRVTPDRAVLAGLLLAAAVYCRDLRYGFILDDVPLILMNETIASWRNWKILFVTHIFYAPGPAVPISVAAKHYRPVYMLWMMLNEKLFGSVVPWWHLTSLLLHVCVVFLVYRLGLKVLREPWTAALAALLFAFHPIHVESVSYVSASTDLLVTLFLLISFLCYARFREQGASPGYLAAAISTAALAMLSKETAVMYPWILVAYEALREPSVASPAGNHDSTRDWIHDWKRYLWTLPFFAVVGAYLLVRTALFGGNMGPGPGESRIAALADIPLVLVVYLRNLLGSFRLSFFYPIEWTSQWTFFRACALVPVVVAVALLWKRYGARPGVRLQLLWTAIFFVPPVLTVATLLKEDWVHDRHMYLVSVPVCLIAAALLTDRAIPRKVSVVASALVLALLFFETAVQVPNFTDEITLYQHTLSVAPRNFLAHRFYAFALWNYGRYDDTLREFHTMAELWPADPEVYGDEAAALAELGRYDEAAAQYQAALQRAGKPTVYRAYLLYRLAAIEVKHSQSAEAAAHIREALRIAPEAPDYHAVLAQALDQQGRTLEASEQMHLEADIRQRSRQDAATQAK